MGSAFSLTKSCVCLDVDDEEKVDECFHIVMPYFYLEEHTFSKEDFNAVLRSWRLIVDGNCNYYQRLKLTNEIEVDQSCLNWLGHVFIRQFSAVCPSSSTDVDETILSQYSQDYSVLLSHMFTSIDNTSEIHSTLIDCAIKNSRQGFHAIEYSLLAETFLYSLKYCLNDEFTPYIETCWVKVTIF
jgi:hypothetical protein